MVLFCGITPGLPLPGIPYAWCEQAVPEKTGMGGARPGYKSITENVKAVYPN
jgi:hypothetical protein